MPDATLLAIGDVHLGRRPTRLRADLEARVVPAVALKRAVDEALERGVDAVLFAGDVVDASEHFLEAYGPLQREVKRLTQHGIPCVGVAGNHDVHVLPRLASEIPAFQLLGAGGSWESTLIRGRERPLARIVGWSFPRSHVSESPMATWPREWSRGLFGDDAPKDLPTVGLLHCDLENQVSEYAPVRRADLLSARGVMAWLLGHVHRPSLDGKDACPLGYLGSLCALHPNETGRHGPWLVELSGAEVALHHLALSPVRYEDLAVDLAGALTKEHVEEALLRGIQELRAELRQAGDDSRGVDPLDTIEALVVRLKLEGATEARRRDRVQAMQALVANPPDDDHVVDVSAWVDDTRPIVDLEPLAGESSPLGILARRLLDLEAGGAQELVAATKIRQREIWQQATFSSPEGVDVSDVAVRARLIRAGRAALETLLGQRAGGQFQDAETQESESAS